MQIPTPDEFVKAQGYKPFPRRWDAWLSAAREAILSAQPQAGRHVTTDEHPGKGTVINVERQRAAPAGEPTGACCDPCGVCLETTEAGCTGIWMGDGSVCDPNPCECPQFSVSIHFEFNSTVAPVDGFADFTKTSDPITADSGVCFQQEDWAGTESMTYHCTEGDSSATVTFDVLDYALFCSGGSWSLAIDWAASELVCGRNFAFQPINIVPDDPTGTYVYTLDAFSGTWHFTITVDITAYP